MTDTFKYELFNKLNVTIRTYIMVAHHVKKVC